MLDRGHTTRPRKGERGGRGRRKNEATHPFVVPRRDAHAHLVARQDRDLADEFEVRRYRTYDDTRQHGVGGRAQSRNGRGDAPPRGIHPPAVKNVGHSLRAARKRAASSCCSRAGMFDNNIKGHRDAHTCVSIECEQDRSIAKPDGERCNLSARRDHQRGACGGLHLRVRRVGQVPVEVAVVGACAENRCVRSAACAMRCGARARGMTGNGGERGMDM